jgi:tetratricopeptide (TPR) repeat protein
MKLIVYILLTGIIIAGCSGSEETVENIRQFKQELSVINSEDKAIEHFVNGSVAESKNDYTSAILEFNKALLYDTSAGIYFALAKNYLVLNKLSNALENAKLSIKHDDTELEYYDLLADIYIQASASDSAAVVLERMIELDSSRVNTYYKLARIYEDAKPLKAIETYEQLTRIIGPDWNVLIHVADLYEKLGYKEEASRSLKELLSIDPSNLALQKLIVDFYQRNEKYDEAMSMLDDIIELRPDDLDAREKKAQVYILQDDWASAAEQYNYILEQPHVPLELKISIGATYFSKSITDSTVLPYAKNLFESINEDTTDWQVELYLGAIAISEGDDETAIEHFKYVTENARWHVDAWIRLGGLYFDNQKYEEAEKIMNEAIELFPNEFAVNLILGLSLAQQGKNIEAQDYLKKATELNPNDITALSAYGFSLSQLSENEVAADYIRRALILKPDDVNLLGQLGLLYNNMQYMEESDSLYEKALELAPENALINNNYAYSLSERGLQLERALEMVTIAIEADSLNSSYLDTVGWIHFKLGNYDEAQYYIQKAVDLGGEDNAVLLEHLGDVLFMQGKELQAQELWQKALDLDSSNDNLKTKVETGVI